MRNQSALDRLRAQYAAWAKTQSEQTLKVPVLRAAGGDLRVVYTEPDWNDSKLIERRMLTDLNPDSDDLRPALIAWAELLAKACVDIQIHAHDGCSGRDGDGKSCKNDDHWHDGIGAEKGLMSFHGAAVELGLLGMDGDPVAAVFAVLAGDSEVDRHGQLVNEWSPSVPASPEVAAEFVGESVTPGSSTSSPEPA